MTNVLRVFLSNRRLVRGNLFRILRSRGSDDPGFPMGRLGHVSQQPHALLIIGEVYCYRFSPDLPGPPQWARSQMANGTLSLL
jgi:hypothetical protein